MRPTVDVGEAVAEAVVAVGDDRRPAARGSARRGAGRPRRWPAARGSWSSPTASSSASAGARCSRSRRARSPRPTASMSTAWRSARTSMRSLARLRAQRRVELPRLLRAVEHDAVDEAHHVERRPVDLDVRAQPERRRHRHRRLADGGDDLVLARHVVGRRQHVAERRAAQHEPRAVAAGDRERQVGAAAADQRRVERADGPLDVGLQPGADLREIESFEHGAKVVARRRGRRARRSSRGGRRRRRLPQFTDADASRRRRCSGRGPAGRRRGTCSRG